MIRRSSNVAVLLLTVLGASSAAPAASTYDQRQEGGANFNVDLENFIVLVARPSATSTSGLDLLGSLASLNAMAGLGSTFDASRAAAAPATESEARESEAKDRMDAEVGEQKQEEQPVVKAQLEEKDQPEKAVAVQAAPEGEKAGRSLEDIVRTLRNLKSKQPAKEEARGSAGKYKFVDAVEEPQNLKLVGDGLENCGPGRSRDRLGICEGDAVSPE